MRQMFIIYMKLILLTLYLTAWPATLLLDSLFIKILNINSVDVTIYFSYMNFLYILKKYIFILLFNLKKKVCIEHCKICFD